MYHLFSGLFKQITAQTVYSILIVGLDNAGKTSLFNIVMKYDYETATASASGQPHTIPTVGLNAGKVTVSDGSVMQLWDLGGQESLRPLWKHYMAGASGVVFVLDSTDIDRLAEVRRELFALLKEPLLDNAPVLILANKQDMSQARNISEISTIIGVSTSGDVEEGGGGGLFDRPIEVIGISCLDGSGISRAIEWLVDQVSNNSRRVIDNK